MGGTAASLHTHTYKPHIKLHIMFLWRGGILPASNPNFLSPSWEVPVLGGRIFCQPQIQLSKFSIRNFNPVCGGGHILPALNPNFLSPPWEVSILASLKPKPSKSSMRSANPGRRGYSAGLRPKLSKSSIPHEKFQSWVGELPEQNRVFCPKWAKSFCSLASSCIADSLSHTMSKHHYANITIA